MTFSRLVLVLALCAAALSTACGGSYSCQDLCTASNACPGTTVKDDCPSNCNRIAALNASAGCGAQFDAMLSCADSHQSAICTEVSTSPCSAQFNAYSGCVTPYCSAHSSDANCK
jgi:hypothetical protein